MTDGNDAKEGGGESQRASEGWFWSDVMKFEEMVGGGKKNGARAE